MFRIIIVYVCRSFDLKIEQLKMRSIMEHIFFREKNPGEIDSISPCFKVSIFP